MSSSALAYWKRRDNRNRVQIVQREDGGVDLQGGYHGREQSYQYAYSPLDFGARLNGTFDDAPGIQRCFDAAANDGLRNRVVFPPGRTAKILTPAGSASLTDGLTYVGLALPGNVSVDFNGSTLDASAANWGAGDTLLAVVDAIGVTDPYDNFLTTIQNGKLKGNSNFDSLVFCGDKTGYGVPHKLFRRMKLDTANSLLVLADNAYNLQWESSGFTGWGASGYAITSFGGSTNWGEGLTWDRCGFFNGAGGVLRARSDAYAGYHFGFCRFDYVKQVFLCDSTNMAQVTSVGGHYEMNANDAKYGATQSMFQIADTATQSQIHLVGGTVIVKAGGTGNNLDYIVDEGATSAVGPYGVVWDRVVRSLSGVALNRAPASAGRFADNA